jgi:hypothetical protein
VRTPGVFLVTGFLLCTCLRAQSPFQIHGYIQGRYTDEESTPDLLEIRRARVIVSGDPWRNLSYRFQVDFVKRPYLMDASLTWKFSRALTVSAGQMKIPFSAESLISDNLNAPVARSRAVLGLAPGRDTGVQGRDVGFQMVGAVHGGNGPMVEYAAGVFRGQTLVSAPKVHYHASAGRVVAHPVRGLSIGGDWYGSFTAPARLEKRREEIEGAYERGRQRIRAEQIWARDGTLHRRGGYLLDVWRVAKNWEAVGRVDWLTTNTQKANTTSIAYIAGANRFLWDHVKVGLDAGAQRDQGRAVWSSVFFAQVMIYY